MSIDGASRVLWIAHIQAFGFVAGDKKNLANYKLSKLATAAWNDDPGQSLHTLVVPSYTLPVH
jgi:hypothetical protein